MKSILFMAERAWPTPAQCAEIESIAPGWQIIAGIRDDDALAEAFAQCEIAVDWNAKAANWLRPGLPLRWVQAFSAGVDMIPQGKLAASGILLTSASGVHAYPVSETALGLMIAMARGFAPSAHGQARHEWRKESSFPSRVDVLHGKTVGILGAGVIGAALAQLCKAFSMRVLGLTRSGQVAPADAALFDRVLPTSQLDALLPECDYVVNILPLTAQTHHIINSSCFSAMKKGAFYINVGRGPSTDTDALVAALESGHLRGAGLDVTDPEPLPANSPLWDMDNVFILPHLGGLHPGYEAHTMELFFANLQDYIAGRSLGTNLVDYSRGY